MRICVQDNFDFPRNAVVLGEELNERAKSGGMQIPPSILEQFGSREGETLVKQMKLCFQTAVAISPLVALTPMHWNISIQRQYLLSVSVVYPHCCHLMSPVLHQVAHSLGNTKPQALREVENALWRAILRVASRSSAGRELREFTQEYKDLLDNWKKDDVHMDYHFFDNCK